MLQICFAKLKQMISTGIKIIWYNQIAKKIYEKKCYFMLYLYLPRYLEISLLQWRHSIRLHALPILYKLPILPSSPFIRAEKEISKILHKPGN